MSDLTGQFLAKQVFDALPSWTKSTITFTRTVGGVLNPSTDDVVGTSTVTASAPCVLVPAKGTLSDSFVEGLAVLNRFLIAIVPAYALGSFVPRVGDHATARGSSDQYTVSGVEQQRPDATTPIVYRITLDGSPS